MYKFLLTLWFIISLMPAQTIIGSGNTKLNLFNHLIENNIHKTSFIKLKQKLKKKFPKLKIDFNLMSLNDKIKKF